MMRCLALVSSLLLLSVSTTVYSDDEPSYIPKRDNSTAAGPDVTLPDESEATNQYPTPVGLKTFVPDKNPYTELRKIIKEKGNITQEELNALANTMAPPPERPTKAGAPPPNYRQPSVVGTFGDAHSGESDVPYLFGLDNKERAQQLMDLRTGAPDEQPEQEEHDHEHEEILMQQPGPPQDIGEPPEESGSVIDKFIPKKDES